MYIHYEPSSPEQGLQAVELLLFASMAVNALQQLRCAAAYGNRGLFAWRLQRHIYALSVLRSPAWGSMLGGDGMAAFAIFRLGLMVTLTILPGFARGPLPSLQATLLTVLFLVNSISQLRSFITATAADQLGSMVLLGLVACAWWPDMLFHAITLCVIAGQVLLCYMTNGLIKLMEANWRSGAALHRLMQLENYSLPAIRTWAAKANPTIFRRLSLGVIFWELSAVTVPFLPKEALYVFLAGGALFHLFIALVMGLNTFFWVFLSTYPAILFLNGLMDMWLS